MNEDKKEIHKTDKCSYCDSTNVVCKSFTKGIGLKFSCLECAGDMTLEYFNA